MQVESYLRLAIKHEVSDIFFVAGSPPAFRKDGLVTIKGGVPLDANSTRVLIEEIYTLAERKKDRLLTGNDDFSFSMPGKGRFRANVFCQRGSLAAVIRVFSFVLPNPEVMRVPEVVMQLANTPKGLVLVTGPAGSGKSTTLACMVDKINAERAAHIITMEDPIEFLHRHKKSIVTQREIGGDSQTYAAALRAGLRQSPDVILVGEMRDLDTIEIAITAAETGQLVLSSLHTVGAANTIDRILDIFPSGKQAQVRVQLSMVLRAVVSQQLVPSVSGALVPVFEIMLLTPAIRNLIREAKVHQIEGAIFSGVMHGMTTMDQSLINLYRLGVITADVALQYCTNLDEMRQKLARTPGQNGIAFMQGMPSNTSRMLI